MNEYMKMADLETKMEQLDLGEWRVDRLLGSGAFGKVLLVVNESTGEKMAVKKIQPDSPFVLENRWDKELEILNSLNHPGIVTSLPVPPALEAMNRDTPILCMEYCSGGDLRQVLNKPVNCCGLPEKDMLHVLGDISGAIVYLHSVKVVHRDIKPENVVIQLSHNKTSYKLIDLGYAKDLSKQSLCHTLAGTLQYLAPELLIPNEKYNNTVDYWSLGTVIHECITGIRPFLPGIPLVQWVQNVECKSRNDICIYANPDGKVIFSTKIFNENHLSSARKLWMEDWLKLMLEWDPAKRGRLQASSSPPGPIVAFQMLEKILSAEVVSIFWVDQLSFLSYAVSDDVSMGTIHEWIERDTGISQQHQLLLLARGHAPDLSKSARQLLSCEEFGNACLFSKFNDGKECKFTQVYPEFTESMLANPREECEYRTQKRMWAQSVFFINHQTSLYRKLKFALRVISTYMTVKAALLKQQVDYVNGAFRHVISCHDLFATSLRQDQYNYKLQSQRGGLPSSALLEKWGNDEIMLHNTLTELKSKIDMLENELQCKMTRLSETAKLAGTFLANLSDALDKYYQQAIELYAELQKRTREERTKPGNNIAMIKCVVKAVKCRDQLLTECFSQIRIVEKTTFDLDNFTSPLFTLKSEIAQFQENIFFLQRQRQNDTWTLLERAVTLWQHSSMMNQPNGPRAAGGVEPSLVSLPSLSVCDSNAQESLIVIQENQSLRYQIQDTLTRGLSATCMSKQQKPDWGFLDD